MTYSEIIKQLELFSYTLNMMRVNNASTPDIERMVNEALNFYQVNYPTIELVEYCEFIVLCEN